MAKDINLEYLLISLETVLDEVKKLGTSYNIDDPKVQGTIMAIISTMRVYLAKDYDDYIRNRRNE